MRVRVFDERDIPAAAALFARVAPGNGWATRAECERYFRAVLFDSPWKDLQLSSWVAEEEDRIVGFYAVLPRRMLFRGRTLRVAVGCQIIVEPEPRFGLVALQLAQACLSGPQDLTLADGASARAECGSVWAVSHRPLYNLQWTRLLRPAGAVAAAASLAARPLAALADGLAARLIWNRFYKEPDRLLDEEIDAAAMLEHLPAVAGADALQPIYHARSLEWILAEAARKKSLGQWRARSVYDAGQIAACEGSIPCGPIYSPKRGAAAWRHDTAGSAARAPACWSIRGTPTCSMPSHA